MENVTFTREYPYWRAHAGGVSQPGKTQHEALRNLNATLALYGLEAASPYSVMVDYVLEDRETGETEEYTATVLATGDEAPYEAADRFMGTIDERLGDRFYSWTNDVYAP